MVYHLHMLSIPVQHSNVGLWQGQSQDSTVETGAVISSVAQSGKLDGGLGLEAHLRLLGAWTVLCVYPDEGQLFTYPAGLFAICSYASECTPPGHYQRMTYPAPSPPSSPARESFLPPKLPPSLDSWQLRVTHHKHRRFVLSCCLLIKGQVSSCFPLNLSCLLYTIQHTPSAGLHPSDSPHTTTQLFNIFIMSATTVNVKNIAGSTDDKEIRDFFSFW